MQPTFRAHEQTRGPASAAGGTAAVLGQQRQQWEARLASFQRGLDHVMRCDAGDACGSSLCHATKRLMRTYATHDCANPPGASKAATNADAASECKVCKLWGYILAKNKPMAAQPPRWHSPAVQSSTSSFPLPVLPRLTCGLSHSRARATGRIVRGARGAGAASRRVVVTPELLKSVARRV